MLDLCYENRCGSLTDALTQDLPFKIPYTDQHIVASYPDTFFNGDSNIALNIANLFDYISEPNVSEAVVVSYDYSSWIKIIKRCVTAAQILQNQHDPSSIISRRPDTTILVNDALCIKGEAKSSFSDMAVAENELIEKFNPDAYFKFPIGAKRQIIGITTCVGFAKIYCIEYLDNRYTANILKIFNMSEMDERVGFLIYIFKIISWLYSISGPAENFHLVPNLRLKTNNLHHITWRVDGIYKEFHKKRQDISFQNIQHVYDQKFPHIESGTVDIVSKSIIITKIGYKLTTSNLLKFKLTKDMVKEQVQLGLDELHSVLLAHCDLSINNVFIDANGVVFLDDLEYLTGITDPPPFKNLRLPFGTDITTIRTCLDLDKAQYIKFCQDVETML